MTNTHGFIFDMDGVIVHSNPAHKKAIKIFCDKYEQNVSDEFLENRVYGRTNKEWIPELFGEIEDDKLRTLANEKEQMFRDIFPPKENSVAGIGDFLERVSQKDIPMAVATSAPGENAEYILSSLNIKHYFDAILDSSHVSKGKPNPEVYLKASEALSKKAEDCVVFEDSVAGVKAGLNAGAKVVGVTTTHSKEELSSCDMAIHDFKNLNVKKMLNLFAGG